MLVVYLELFLSVGECRYFLTRCQTILPIRLPLLIQDPYFRKHMDLQLEQTDVKYCHRPRLNRQAKLVKIEDQRHQGYHKGTDQDKAEARENPPLVNPRQSLTALLLQNHVQKESGNLVS